MVQHNLNHFLLLLEIKDPFVRVKFRFVVSTGTTDSTRASVPEKKKTRQSAIERRKCNRVQDDFSVWPPSALGTEFSSKPLKGISTTALRMFGTTIKGRQKGELS